MLKTLPKTTTLPPAEPALGLGAGDMAMAETVAEELALTALPDVVPQDLVPGQKNGGRVPGPAKRRALVLRELAEDMLADPTYQSNLKARLKDGKCPPAIEVLLWQYTLGRPTEAKEEPPPPTPIRIVHELMTTPTDES